MEGFFAAVCSLFLAVKISVWQAAPIRVTLTEGSKKSWSAFFARRKYLP
jgi:hypothetical protein